MYRSNFYVILQYTSIMNSTMTLEKFTGLQKIVLRITFTLT